MVVDGVTTNPQQIAIYGQALKESGLHLCAGSYYLNDPRPLRILEGNRDQNHVTLLINFLSECAAINFWNCPFISRKQSLSGKMQAITQLRFIGSFNMILTTFSALASVAALFAVSEPIDPLVFSVLALPMCTLLPAEAWTMTRWVDVSFYENRCDSVRGISPVFFQNRSSD